jgi:histidine phosphotransfer protein HptB
MNAIDEFATHEGDVHPSEPIIVEVIPKLEQLSAQYLVRRREEIPVLMQLLAASDFDRIRALAHDLKGTGSAFGFADVTKLGAAMEISAKQADRTELTIHMEALREYLGRVTVRPIAE